MTDALALAPVALLPHSVVVGIAYSILRVTWRRFHAEAIDAWLLWIPPVFYLALDEWRDRQGLAIVFALAIVTVVVTVALPLKVLLRERRRSALAIVGVGCLAALICWLALPNAQLEIEIW